MITVEDFKKLIELENSGLWIFCDGEEVCGLMYDNEIDPEEFILPKGCTDAREMCCHFHFENDRYTTVCCLNEYKNGTWTVMEATWIEDWRNYTGD